MSVGRVDPAPLGDRPDDVEAVGVWEGASGLLAGEDWLSRRTYDGAQVDPERLARLLDEQALTVSVVVPALEVADTIGEIVDAVRVRWVEDLPIVGELIVIDSHSADGTARLARQAGARVVQADEVLPGLEPGVGKGEALWKSLACTAGDLVVWIDGDTHRFDPAYVPRLLWPLACEPAVSYVKGFYARPLGSSSLGGGRVTEICARPLLSMFFPPLAALAQPLAGEAAGRRGVLESLPFFGGYGVEMGLLIDMLERHGMDAIAQVDLGERAQDHQPTAALGRMAYAILQVVMHRLAEAGRAPGDLATAGPYLRPALHEGIGMERTPVALSERPPMAQARLGTER